jgi:hypothetical protein
MRTVLTQSCDCSHVRSDVAEADGVRSAPIRKRMRPGIAWQIVNFTVAPSV